MKKINFVSSMIIFLMCFFGASVHAHAQKKYKKMRSNTLSIYARDTAYRAEILRKGEDSREEIDEEDNAYPVFDLFETLFVGEGKRSATEKWEDEDFDKFKSEYIKNKEEGNRETNLTAMPDGFVEWTPLEQEIYFQRRMLEVNSKRRKILDIDPNEIIYSDRVESYIQIFAPEALKNQAYYRIPASVTLAQAIVESAAGTSFIATNAKNHFGIHYHSGAPSELGREPKTLGRMDWGSWAKFIIYRSPHESFHNHAIFLINNTRYKNCFECEGDFECFIDGLADAGYSEDPRYPFTLKEVIERLHLDLFDAPSLKNYFHMEMNIYKRSEDLNKSEKTRKENNLPNPIKPTTTKD